MFYLLIADEFINLLSSILLSLAATARPRFHMLHGVSGGAKLLLPAHGAGHGQIGQAEVVDVGPGGGPAGTTRYGLS